MGERSKIIGEFGEKTVENFLNLIGWKEIPKNIEFTCNKSNKHSKTTHGIDFYYAYKSPLTDAILKSISISVKFSGNPYPNSPNSTFKKHFEDLVYAIECFKHSPERNEIISSLHSYSKVEEVGVLFWLNNSETTYNNLIEKIATAQLVGDYNFDQLFVVDNNRIDFIYQVLTFSKAKFLDCEINFYYPDTGKNLIPTEKRNCGPILPVEYINSSIIPLRIENKITKKIALALYTIDSFSVIDLKRLMGLAQDISKSWTSSIIIGFPDFNELNHMNDIRAAKNSFENVQFKENLEIISFVDNFKSLQRN